MIERDSSKHVISPDKDFQDSQSCSSTEVDDDDIEVYKNAYNEKSKDEQLGHEWMAILLDAGAVA